MAEGRSRPAWAEIDLDAIAANAAVLSDMVAPAELCAVVKADAYGHGAPAVALAALEGGATRLAVAIADEGLELRAAGIEAPVLVLSETPVEAAGTVVAAGLTATVCSVEAARALGAAAREVRRTVAVHVKVDTGMHRVGASPEAVPALVDAVAGEQGLELEGLWTHLAVADGTSAEDRAFTERQLDSFDSVVARVAAGGHRPPLLHAANSAGAIAWPRARYAMVRCGIALYGHLPAPGMADALAAALGPGRALTPALALRARVSAVRRLEAGARPSYGRLRPLPGPSIVATVPIGYADGVPRALFGTGYEVLIAGHRHPLAGMVTMDQIVVDCGPDAEVAPGDEVTLLGRQGTEEVTVAEWAGALGTISYEVLCGIGPRVPRVTVRAGDPRTAADEGCAEGAER